MIGASGLLLAVGLGALRAMRGSGKAVCDMIPVDTVAYGIIAAAWRTAMQYAEAAKEQPPRRPPLPIYHLTSSTKNPLLWEWVRAIVEGYFTRHPTKKRVGAPWVRFTNNKVVHYFAHLLLHMGPAALLDAQRVLTGKKARMLKATSKLQKTILSLAYFTTHSWVCLAFLVH